MLLFHFLGLSIPRLRHPRTGGGSFNSWMERLKDKTSTNCTLKGSPLSIDEPLYILWTLLMFSS